MKEVLPFKTYSPDRAGEMVELNDSAINLPFATQWVRLSDLRDWIRTLLATTKHRGFTFHELEELERVAGKEAKTK